MPHNNLERMNEEDKVMLLEYEMPSIAEFISIGWMQNIVAKLLAHKINKKLARYRKRQERKQWLKSVTKTL